MDLKELVNDIAGDDTKRASELRTLVELLTYASDEDLIDIFKMLIDNVNKSNSDEDIINSPDHYTSGPIECFDLIRAMEGDERAAGFAIGNCWKYLYRHRMKGHDTEDIRKMIKYANFYLDIIDDGA